MQRSIKYFFLMFLVILSLNGALMATDVLPRDKFAVNSSGQIKAWIYFTDKTPLAEATLQKAQQILTERAVQRRLKVKSAENLLDESDLPINPDYMETIRPFVTRIRARSRWLNAVSVEMDFARLSAIRELDCVKKIAPVLVYRRIQEPEQQIPQSGSGLKKAAADSLDYGDSATQLEMINVPALHQQGYYGEGVLIGMLDDGFNLVYLHRALKHLDIVDTWDFIHNDKSVEDSELSATEGTHGTKTLSAIGGYYPGYLIGPAFKASYLLAKTEVDGSETQIEEDFWVAGLEWCDSLGADLVSSSLGYIDWYTWQDMNGQTAVTTIAADMAFDRGLLIFNSAGNEGDNSENNTLIAPADGFNVMAVAAVDRSEIRSSFSSVGPSADGRIKPDIAAMGSSVVVASASDTTKVVTNSGTSFSCPLAAGSAALLLNVFPELTPQQTLAALRNTASQSGSPDRYLGWGVIDVQQAVIYADTATAAVDTYLAQIPENLAISQNYPNPFNSETRFTFQVKHPSRVDVEIYSITGQKLLALDSRMSIARKRNDVILNSRLLGNLSSGCYLYRVTAFDLLTGSRVTRTRKMLYLR
jgi:subtilisin family serine protease